MSETEEQYILKVCSYLNVAAIQLPSPSLLRSSMKLIRVGSSTISFCPATCYKRSSGG